MIIFDQLEISTDGKQMYINLHVDRADYFKDLTLDTLTILTADAVSETDPNVPTEGFIYQKTFDEGLTEASLVLQPTDMNVSYTKSNFSSDLFFVYVTTDGTPDISTPCALDEQTSLGITFDETLLYQKIMQFTKSLADNCQMPVEFTDFILLWNAFKISVETGHYIPAIKYYNMLFDKSKSITIGTSKSCGCHG